MAEADSMTYAMAALGVIVILALVFAGLAARSRSRTPGGNHDLRRAGADPGAYDMRRDPGAIRAAAAERFDTGDQAAARAGAGRKLTKHGHSGYVQDVDRARGEAGTRAPDPASRRAEPDPAQSRGAPRARAEAETKPGTSGGSAPKSFSPEHAYEDVFRVDPPGPVSPGGPPPLRIPINDLKRPPLRGGAPGVVAVAGAVGSNEARAAELTHLIKTKQKIAAIKLYREMTGVDLAAAKGAVDVLERAVNRKK